MATYDAFLSGDTLKRLPQGGTKIFRVVSVYCRPFDPDKDTVLEFKIETGHTTEDGGVVQLNDKELAEKVEEAIENEGYTIVEQKNKVFEIFSQKDQTVLAGAFELEKTQPQGA